MHAQTFRLPPGKDVTWRDADLPDDIAFLAAAKKLDRVAAFRQMQSISHQLLHLTGGRVCLERFALPEEACLRSVANDEVRLLRVIDGKNVAVLKNSVASGDRSVAISCCSGTFAVFGP